MSANADSSPAEIGGAEQVGALYPLGRRKTMGQDVLGSLREAIVMGAIPPGSQLRLKDLSAQLGVSFSPIREALRQLEILGLVEHLPYRGTRVSLLTLEEMRETYEIREALESLSVRRAAERFSGEDVSACRAALDEIEQGYAEDDGKRITQANTAFHLAIAKAARSAALFRSIAAVCETSERYSASLFLRPGSSERQTIERQGHLDILEACADHDAPRAQVAVREHIAVFERLATPQMESAREP